MDNVNETLSTVYAPKQSYIRVATAKPRVTIADCGANAQAMARLFSDAAEKDVSLIVFPELAVTGYSIGDVVLQTALLEQARASLLKLATLTKGKETVMVIGLPLQFNNVLYNCAAVLAKGHICGIVPKSNLPSYGEFYEDRWFQVWHESNTHIMLGKQAVPFGTRLLFDIDTVRFGVEICEDAWVAQPPSIGLCQNGALLIANPSASPEQVGKDTYRRNLVEQLSGRLLAGYIYAGCDTSESTMDVVMGGHQLIAESGRILAEIPPFEDGALLVADVDIDHLRYDRRRQSFENYTDYAVLPTGVERKQKTISGAINTQPFMPQRTDGTAEDRLRQIVAIQAHGLAGRLRSGGHKHVVIGISGGLDSTLALLVALETARILRLPASELIRTLVMPGPASSKRTQDNARTLVTDLGLKTEVIPIHALVQTELSALGRDQQNQDVTYENVQARIRTTLLFNYANAHHCLVVGTGDLSELALGWCTYNGDHMSHYNINASIPKTLVRHLVQYLADKHPNARTILKAILETPISPELTKNSRGISQHTETLVGPYELHDFFLYYHIRWGDSAPKIYYLACWAFEGRYSASEIHKWLIIYFERFTRNQFKRSALPDGPKVGSVALSPRGDWRMPSDMPNASLWQL